MDQAALSPLDCVPVSGCPGPLGELALPGHSIEFIQVATSSELPQMEELAVSRAWYRSTTLGMKRYLSKERLFHPESTCPSGTFTPWVVR